MSAGIVPVRVRHNGSRMRRIRSFTVTPQQYRLVAYAALIVCTMIVFTGAAVRVTRQGASPRRPDVTGRGHRAI